MIAPIVIKCKLFTTLCYLYACKCVYPFQHRASDEEEEPQEENGIIIVQTCTCPTCVSDFMCACLGSDEKAETQSHKDLEEVDGKQL